AIALARAPGLDDQRSGIRGLRRFELHVRRDALVLAFVLTKPQQAGEALHIALAARRHAVSQPVFFIGDLAIEFVTVDLFLLERFVAPRLELREALPQQARLPAVQPQRVA